MKQCLQCLQLISSQFFFCPHYSSRIKLCDHIISTLLNLVVFSFYMISQPLCLCWLLSCSWTEPILPLAFRTSHSPSSTHISGSVLPAVCWFLLTLLPFNVRMLQGSHLGYHLKKTKQNKTYLLSSFSFLRFEIYISIFGLFFEVWTHIQLPYPTSPVRYLIDFKFVQNWALISF